MNPTRRPSKAVSQAMGRLALALFFLMISPRDAAAQGMRQEQPADRPLQRQLSEVGERLAQSEESLFAQYTTLHQQLDALLAAHERAPALDVGSEQQRMILLKNMLNRVIRLGKPLVEDASKYQNEFAEWKLASGNAAQAYRAAESHFKTKATESKYDEEKQFYLASAKFYGARAARQELLRARALPTDMKTEIDRLQRLVTAVEDLYSFVENDDYVLTAAIASSQYAEFMVAFSKTGTILDKWGDVLMKDLIEEEAETSQAPRP